MEVHSHIKDKRIRVFAHMQAVFVDLRSGVIGMEVFPFLDGYLSVRLGLKTACGTESSP